MSYCESSKGHPFHGPYHDDEYGFPLHDDNLLFGRLILEINQAGLSWLTILKKKDNFVKAYNQFEVKRVAAYGQKDIERLLGDAGIIRNKLKVNAAIHNAKQILLIQDSHGSFEKWLDENHPLTKDEWVKLFKTKFKFVGGEIVGEFLMSTGYLPGAHDDNCPTLKKIKRKSPKWMTS